MPETGNYDWQPVAGCQWLPTMTVTLVARAEYARAHGVSKAAAQKWEKRGLLVVVDGKINVEASDRKMMHAGMGRFSNRAVRSAPSSSAPHATIWDGQVSSLPLEARVLIAFVGRIAAHGGLTAWECGADLPTAQKIDGLFRFLLMDAAAELLTDIETPAPNGFTWANAAIWDDEFQAQIEWSAMSEAERDEAHAES